VSAVLPQGATATWDFGDGSETVEGASRAHTYARPGTYRVGLRVVHQGRLFEHHAAVTVSALHEVSPPLTAFPRFTADPGADDVPAGHHRVVGSTGGADGEPVSTVWRVAGRPATRAQTGTFDLPPGVHRIVFTAVRTLTVRLTGRQVFAPDAALAMEGLRLRSNRTFDESGETTTEPDAVTEHLFGGGPVSPVDRWTVRIDAQDNPFLRSVSATDVEQVDLSPIDDAVLILEYVVVDG
jgi:uncharacterized cupin superfamily protein